jgi:hypothetical protein
MARVAIGSDLVLYDQLYIIPIQTIQNNPNETALLYIAYI